MKLSDQALGQIAARCRKRWDRHYVPIKLATDPVYAAVADLVLPTALPVLDIGCGIGLLTHDLRGLGSKPRSPASITMRGRSRAPPRWLRDCQTWPFLWAMRARNCRPMPGMW